MNLGLNLQKSLEIFVSTWCLCSTKASMLSLQKRCIVSAARRMDRAHDILGIYRKRADFIRGEQQSYHHEITSHRFLLSRIPWMNESEKSPFRRSGEFFKTARRTGSVIVSFSLVPCAFIYEQLPDDPMRMVERIDWDDPSTVWRGFRKGSYATGRTTSQGLFGAGCKHVIYSPGSNTRSFHTIHCIRFKQKDGKKVTCNICKSQVQPLTQGHNNNNNNNNGKPTDGGRPRLVAPEERKALPEPQLDYLYFYNYFSRDEIMRGISGVLPRLRARIRRALKGSYQKRPWTIDDIFALITWAVMSQAMLLLIGTTTTVSVALWLLNRLQYQDWIARHLSVWVSSALKITVSFQSAIVPAWRSGAIRLKNVKIRCGPEHGKTNEDGSRDTNFTMYDLQIDQIDVALSLWRWIEDRGLIRECSVRGVRGVVDRRMVGWDSNTIYLPDSHRQSHQPGYFNLDSLEIDDMLLTVHPWKNFRPVTMSIYSANLPLFRDRWLLYDLLCANSVVGMYDGSLFTIHQAHQHISPFKSLPVSASHIYDSKALNNQSSRFSIQEPKLSVCQGRTSHVQIDNLNIDHINSGVGGPIGWITSGRLNVSSLISFPDNEPNADPAAAIKKLVDNISDSIDVVILPSMPDWSTPESSPNPLVRMLYHLDMVDSPLAQGMHGRLKRRAERESQRRLEKQRQRTASWSQPLAPITTHQIGSAMPSVSDTQGHSNTSPIVQLPDTHEDPNAVHVDLQVEFNGIRASVPLSTPQLGHPLLSSVLVRPIVGYMNAHRTSLPMRCQLRLKPDDFDGAWSLWDSGADDLITQGIGSAFAQLAQDERKRNRHLKLVGMWSVAAIVKHILRLVDFIYDRNAFFDYFSLSGEAEHV